MVLRHSSFNCRIVGIYKDNLKVLFIYKHLILLGFLFLRMYFYFYISVRDRPTIRQLELKRQESAIGWLLGGFLYQENRSTFVRQFDN
jgi:hypothetical protein